ncbi:NAD(P)-dependent oxidoreductase [Leucobacter sp. wl10]|uniref:NAD(P)-dependent oxidoreductase n=1 Tax=Leucobacter sp. wl10 TaxID=2304677 RepID=UPI000E5BC2AF|nr:NAD(P)-dependent oxidoreductase [Leucobacter sp. wl10]RGE21124.1 phosphoglycerate dehydrogenase [Leucobacter sp. wl10]
MNWKVLAGWHADEPELARVRDGLGPDAEVQGLSWSPGLDIPYGAERSEYLAKAADADAILTWTLPDEVVEAAARLRFVAWMHSGCDRLPLRSMAERGIRLANVPNAHQPAISEHAWALVLACVKQIVRKHAEHVAGQFVPYWRDGGVGSVLHGSTITIVGAGQIGTRVAAVARAFEMEVRVVRRNPAAPTPSADRVYGQGGLHEALRGASVVVLAAPSTDLTRGMMDRAAFAEMDPGACLVNIARGDLVVERAVYDALTCGELGAFASDVWWDYEDAMPPGRHFSTPSRLGVHRLPNVVVSGDQASNAYFVRDVMLESGVSDLRAMLDGRRADHEVNLLAGY